MKEPAFEDVEAVRRAMAERLGPELAYLAVPEAARIVIAKARGSRKHWTPEDSGKLCGFIHGTRLAWNVTNPVGCIINNAVRNFRSGG